MCACEHMLLCCTCAFVYVNADVCLYTEVHILGFEDDLRCQSSPSSVCKKGSFCFLSAQTPSWLACKLLGVSRLRLPSPHRNAVIADVNAMHMTF